MTDLGKSSRVGSPFPGGRLIVVLTGPTGSGKTEMLAALASRGEQILDLEGLAGHRGSAFGGLGRPAQPSHAEFQAAVRSALADAAVDRPLWVEDKGDYLGSVGLPAELVAPLRRAPTVEICDVSSSTRVRRILDEYGPSPVDAWLRAVDLIALRLGEARTHLVRRALKRGDRAGAVRILLTYYDAGYRHRAAGLDRPLLGVVGPAEADIAVRLV